MSIQLKPVYPRLDLIDRVIRMAELALHATDNKSDKLHGELVYGIECIQHPSMIVKENPEDKLNTTFMEVP